MASNVDMDSSETLPQPESADNKPIAAVPFEVVRQAEYVFEPFMGSLIQIPEARMQRAQSSEFFLRQAPSQTEEADVEEPLVWERPQPLARASAKPATDEPLPEASPIIRKARNKKAEKEQEAPRFYQPPTVRFFDPLAAAAEEGEIEEGAELPGPRASTQLSPELKAAILRIDEQRRQMQQVEKQEKPSAKKKRGFLAPKPAARADIQDLPMEIVKPRDVVLTERAARWEEIATPPPRPAAPQLPALPEVPPFAAQAAPPMEAPAAAATPVEPIRPASAPPSEVPAIAEALEVADALPHPQETLIHATPPPSPVAEPPAIMPAFEPEAAVPEEIVAMPQPAPMFERLPPPEIAPLQDPPPISESVPIESLAPTAAEDTPAIFAPAAEEELIATPESASPLESLPETESVSLHDAAYSHQAVPVDATVPTPAFDEIEDSALAAQEGSITEEIISTLQFTLTDEDLREPELDAFPIAPQPPETKIALEPPHTETAPQPPDTTLPLPASFEAPAISSAASSLEPPIAAEQTPPLEPAVAADAPTPPLAKPEPLKFPSRKKFKGIAARARHVEPESTPPEIVVPQTPLEQSLEQQAEEAPRKKGKLPFGKRLQQWLGGEASLDGNRRRADRMSMPGLVAFYWSGGSPRPHEIVNISKTGFYLKTKEFWSIETLVRMTIQRPPSETRRKAESISVLARVVRIDEEGVGHEFVTTEALMHARSMDVMPSHGTDIRELDRFLQIRS